MSAGRRRARSSVSRIQRHCVDGVVVSVFRVVPVEQLELAVVLREHEEHERRAEDDRDQSGEVGPVGAVEERRLRGGDDLLRVLRILRGGVRRAGERLGELRLDVGAHAAAFGDPAMSFVNAAAYPAVSSAPRSDCMIAPPRSRWRSAVADAIPARRTGTEPVSECDAGVPASPTPAPTKAYAEPDLPVRAAGVPQREHREEPEEAEDVAAEQGEPRTTGLDELGRARRDDDHQDHRGQDGGPGLERVVAEHVLEELLTDEHRRHERAEHDDAGDRGDPEDAPRGDVEVVERVARTALADHERGGGRRGDRHPGRSRACPCRERRRS